MKRHYVYIVTNTINDKAYVGKHSTMKSHEEDPYKGKGTQLLRAQKKHGRDKFSIFYIEEFSSHEEAYEGEIELIAYYKSIGMELYNLNMGGRGGRDPSLESRAKNAAAHKGKRKGIKFTPEHIANLSAAKKGKKLRKRTLEQSAAQSKRQMGQKATLETRTKMSVSQSNQKQSPEHIAKRSTALKAHYARKRVK